MPSFWDEIKFFVPDEFDQGRGTDFFMKGSGRINMCPEFISALDMMRLHFGKPIVITSGYRSPEYNNMVSSTGHDGPHTTGKAADIAVFGEDCYNLVKIAFHLNFKGIGLKQSGKYSSRFVHLDMIASDLRPRIWTY